MAFQFGEVSIPLGEVQMIYQRSSFLKYAAMTNGTRYLEEDMTKQAERIKKTLAGSPPSLEALPKLEKIRKKLMTFGRYTGLQKLDGVVNTVSEYLRANPEAKAIIFCYYADTMVRLMDITKKEFGTKTIYPGTGPDAVQQKMDLFKGITASNTKSKSKKKTRIIVADIRASNPVLDYSPADHVFFAECAWEPQLNADALKLAKSKKKQQVTFISLSSSLDEQLNKVIKPEVEKLTKG